MKRLLRRVSLLLVLCLLVQSIVVAGVAEEPAPETQAEEEVPYIVEEIEELRGEREKHFLMSDGTSLVAGYKTAVHYEDADGWQDIDNSLVDAGNSMETADSGNKTVALTKTLQGDGTVHIEKDGYEISFGFLGTSASSAQVSEQATYEGDEAYIQLPNLTSETVYENAYANVDAQYIVSPDGVKENLVLKSRNTAAEWRIGYRTDGLAAVQTDARHIELRNAAGEAVYTISAPMMTDAAGNRSDALTLSIEEQEADRLTVKLSADLSWLKAEERSYPVTIDPEVEVSSWNGTDGGVAIGSLSRNINSTENVTIEANTGSAYVGRYPNDASYGQDNIAVLKSTSLPDIGPEGYVKKATLMAPVTSYSGKVAVYDIQGLSAFENVTWNGVQGWISNSGDSRSYPIDVVTGTEPYADYFSAMRIDITSLLQKDYRQGFMVALINETEEAYAQVMKQTVFQGPCVLVNYVSQQGIDESYSYHQQNVGRAGTAYVNDLTGRLYASRTDMSFESEKKTAEIGMDYVAKVTGVTGLQTLNPERYAYTWKDKNYQYLDTSVSGYYAVWYQNGQKIYFNAVTETNESGVSETFGRSNAGDEVHAINGTGYVVTSGGESYTFGSNNRLTKMESDDGNVTIQYVDLVSDNSNFACINKITDGDGREYRYSYDSAWRVTRVGYYGSGSTELSYVAYGYDTNGRLTGVTWGGAGSDDTETATYTYDTLGRLTKLTGADGYAVQYGYEDGAYGRVNSVTEKGNDGTIGNWMTIVYKNRNTVYTDANGMTESLLFDAYGHVETTADSEGNAVFSRQAQDGSFLGSSGISVTPINRLTNHSFEQSTSTTGWTCYTTGGDYGNTTSTTEKLYGLKSARLTRTAEGTVNLNQDFVSPEPGYYTLSAYIKTDNVDGTRGAAVLLHADLADGTSVYRYSEGIKGTNDWTREQCTLEVPENAVKLRVFIGLLGGSGTAYFDGVQLEPHRTAYEYNMLEDGDFNKGSTGWGGSNVVTYAEKKGGLDKKVLRLASNSDSGYVSTSQTVTIDGKEGDSYTLSLWFKLVGGQPTVYSQAPKSIRIIIVGVNNGVAGDTPLREIQLDTTLKDAWHQVAETIGLDSDYEQLSVTVTLEGMRATVYLDGVAIVNDGFYYSGDVDLQPTPDTSEKDPDSEDPVEVTDSFGRTTSYSYNGITNTYEYYGDSKKHTLDRTTVNGISITNRTAYSKNGSVETVTQTDPLGSTFATLTNTDLGVVTGTVDGNSVENSYTYDALQNLLSVVAKQSDGTTALAQNDCTYEHDKVKTISHNGTTYTFCYNAFGDITSIKVGSQTLIQYNYFSNQFRKIANIIYSNEQQISYTYDKNRNIVETKNNNGVMSRIVYDELGNTLVFYDYLSDEKIEAVDYKINYYSITSGNLCRSVSYNEIGLKELYSDNAVYNSLWIQDGKNDGIQFGNVTQTTETDKFGRTVSVTTKVDGAVKMTQSYAYLSPAEGETSHHIGSVTTTVGNTTTVESYTYDANGNILTIRENGILKNSYVYDSLNQLTGEYDYANLKYYQNQYDAGGNMTSRVTLNMTYTPETGITNMSYAGHESYSYENTDWKDQLTDYNGTAITYDNMGNPTDYRGYTMTWELGRQLSMAAGNGKYNSYTYDTNGLRRSKFHNGTTYNYIWTDGNLTHQTDSSGNVWHFYYSDEQVIGFRYNGNDYTYVKNLQGDVVGILDASGAVVASYTYNAWGVLTASTGAMADVNPIRYRGYYYDTETGWYYLQSRYYDPSLRRFVNADDVINIGRNGTAFSNNLFSYCENNPIVRIDSTGCWYYDLNDYLRNNSIDKRDNNIFYTELLKRYDHNIGLIQQFGVGFIYGQGTPFIGEMLFGSANIKNVGCELVAVYNVMKVLGYSQYFHSIVLQFELNKLAWFGGYFGVNPKDIGKFFQAHGVPYEYTNSVERFKSMAVQSRICIVSAWNNDPGINKKKGGIHTIAFSYSLSEKIYYVLNEFSNGTRVAKLTEEDMQYYFKEKKFYCGYRLL